MATVDADTPSVIIIVSEWIAVQREAVIGRNHKEPPLVRSGAEVPELMGSTVRAAQNGLGALVRREGGVEREGYMPV